jgi:murein DD-endopeptidase MepM/ murein hydrolase activator NlpD
VDNLKVSYVIPYTRTECPETDLAYRFGFNTQEKDDEVYGAGNLNTAEFWEYDTRLGRRWNVDPKPQVEISVYAAMNGNPIWLTDVNGDCPPGVKCGDVVNFVPHINNQGTENKNRFERVKRTKPNGKTYFHQGLDILVPSNTKLRVIMSGEVMKNQTTHISDEYSGSRRPRQAQHEGTNGLGNSLIVKTILPEDYSYTPEGGKEMNLKKGQAIFIRYSHMELVGPEEGALVKTGEPIGYSGATGNAGFYKGDWGIEEKYRHVHIEASTDVNFKNKLDPEAFVKTQYNSKGKVIPSSGDGSRPKEANNVIKDF